MSSDDKSVSRRSVLKQAGATGALGLAGLAGCSGDGGGNGDDEYPALGNYPIEGDTAMFGFNVPLSGPYSSEGEDELRAYELAVKHLNNGGGWVDNWDDLSGEGVLDYEIDYVEGDTATDASTADESASRMIQRDDVIMFAGGSSSAVAIAQQGVAQRENVMFTCCLTHSNDTTGQDCVRYSFREMFNAYMTGQALTPVVTEEYGDDLSFYQLYADYSWGKTVEESIRKFFGEAGWEEVNSVATPLDTSDFSSYLSEAQSSGADVLFLNHYGLDGANSLNQAIDAGIDEDMEIVMPLYNRPMAEAASSAIDGIYGTIAWDSQIDNEPSNSFTEFFGEEYDGRVPSGPAQLAYSGTLQYAAAVERAGTFYPPEVIRQLEGFEYDNIGMGDETMRACDHQAQRAIPVVRGLPESEQGDGQFFEIVDITSRDDVGYGCDEGPASQCELGEYGDE
ncbi:amino acid/amide ABC transporter substrate-binding protein, HAAT family [Halomicrobium zhouii]|uniref:Amino acid/amide ABC transporter substrate-binding protein, HAAT family n=1 Tax=Halomicrobium zhouii TaxID=767519 RepID=A0A1I6KQY8_9EURY|nr:substrate-binding protein [Halomicrobium zhouii]SFR93665.1 amino acid/amide ABC transporter substrate-binding protein, HAAT family [Halomicrobium zhouii]